MAVEFPRKGLASNRFSGEIHAVEFGDRIELPFPSRTVEWLITTRPCTLLKVRAASALLPTLFPSPTGSRLSPSSSHQEPSMTWLSPVDRTSGTLTLSAGTLSCLAHHVERPFRSVAPRRPRWNTRRCRWTMRIVCLHWVRSSRSVDNVEKFLSQSVAPWNPARAPRLVTGHPGRTA